MSQKPNILWICTDQQRLDTLGCYGNRFVSTPHLDALAAQSVQCFNMYSQSPVCAPSRASFLSGRYPCTCGVRQNGQDIPDTERLVPRILRDEGGYTCGLSGKLHISVCHPSVCPDMERRIDDGYDVFRWSHHPAGRGKANWSGNDYTNWLTSMGVDFRTTPLDGCKYVDMGMPAEYSQTTWCFSEAIRFIGENQEKPWFFSLNCFDPHHPFDPPKEYFDRYLPILDELPLPDYVPGELDHKPVFQQKDHEGAYNSKGNYPYDEMTDHDHRVITAAYYAMIDQIDHEVGRIIQYLKDIGQYENTLILFTSDHGESLGDHGIYLKGPYCYETGVHVPFIISWPGHTAAGLKRNALMELVDVAPTLLQAAGIPVPEAMQGRSFLPLICDASQPDQFRQSVYCEFYNANINHRDPRAYLTMAFDGRFKVIKTHYADGAKLHPEGELYDLQADPHEHVNLYDNPLYIREKTRMLECLCDRMAQTIDPMPVRRAFW